MKIIGLMSGTSADGLDIALLDISGMPDSIKWELVGFRSYPYPLNLSKRLASVTQGKGRVSTLCRLSYELGFLYGDLVNRFLVELHIEPVEVDLIASHGQTVYHEPKISNQNSKSIGCTMQIAEPAAIHHRTGIAVISDFRAADIVAGGQGAPLAPYCDYLLFKNLKANILLINIGGIANITYLGQDASEENIIGFDTGPGNCLVDEFIRYYGKKNMRYDVDGALAKAGTVDPAMLNILLSHPYFELPPPKSTGKETFNLRAFKDLMDRIKRENIPLVDVLATLSELTVASICEQIQRFVLVEHPVEKILLSGGGAHNGYFRDRIANRFAGIEFALTDEYGIAVDAKEAVYFAILGYLSASGLPGNCPSATGASKRVVLGKLTPPSALGKLVKKAD